MKPHEEWLFKSENDLDSAKFLLNSEKPLYDAAIYHAQQCAEKSFKAYLAFHDFEIEKTHNLIILTEFCISRDPSFVKLKECSEYLNPYSVIYRYPGDELLPTLEETKRAIEYAETVWIFIKDRLKG